MKKRENAMPRAWARKRKNAIGKMIEKKRHEHNMTLNQLSERSGFAFQTLRNWEIGKCTPSIDRLMWLCGKLGWKMSEIINGERMQNFADKGGDKGAGATAGSGA